MEAFIRYCTLSHDGEQIGIIGMGSSIVGGQKEILIIGPCNMPLKTD